MPKFKISVSKNQKKYSIILNTSSEIIARKKVHSEGYSILNVEEINEDKIKGHKFIFEVVDENGNIKKGKIVANDPLKVYIKLKEGLGYNIKILYSQADENKSEKIKLNFLKHLEEQYMLYFGRKGKTILKKEEKIISELKKNNLDNFYIKKELDETYRLIDFVLVKIKYIIDNSNEKEVSLEKKQKIKILYNSIIKLKKTTNIAKLKEIGEKALIKIGNIELSIVEKNKNHSFKKYLKETNSLLKDIGSKEHFIEKEKDINYIFNKFLNEIKDKLSNFKFFKKKKNIEHIDKESSSYWKTNLLINKYTNKEKEIKKEILKTIFKISKKENLNDLKIKLKVVKQNLIILKAKKTGKIVSYTKILKGYKYFIELLLLLLLKLNTYFISFVYIFSLLVLIFLLLDRTGFININININGIFIFIYIIFLSFLIFISRGILSISINIIIYLLIIILGIVNF